MNIDAARRTKNFLTIKAVPVPIIFHLPIAIHCLYVKRLCRWNQIHSTDVYTTTPINFKCIKMHKIIHTFHTLIGYSLLKFRQ